MALSSVHWTLWGRVCAGKHSCLSQSCCQTLLSRTHPGRDLPHGDELPGSQCRSPHSNEYQDSGPAIWDRGQHKERRDSEARGLNHSERTPRSCRKSQVHPITAFELTSFTNYAYVAPKIMSHYIRGQKGWLMLLCRKEGAELALSQGWSSSDLPFLPLLGNVFCSDKRQS